MLGIFAFKGIDNRPVLRIEAHAMVFFASIDIQHAFHRLGQYLVNIEQMGQLGCRADKLMELPVQLIVVLGQRLHLGVQFFKLEKIGSPGCQPPVHFGHAWTGVFAVPFDGGFYSGRHLGVVVHDTADVIGIIQRRGHADDTRHHVGTAGNDADALDIEQFEKKIVPTGVRLVGIGHTLFENQVAIQAFLGGSGGRQTAMVGLDGAAGDN